MLHYTNYSYNFMKYFEIIFRTKTPATHYHIINFFYC